MDFIKAIAGISIVLSAFVFIFTSLSISNEIKDSGYKNRIPLLLLLSGYWIFSKSSFNDGNDLKFFIGRFSACISLLSFFLLF